MVTKFTPEADQISLTYMNMSEKSDAELDACLCAFLIQPWYSLLFFLESSVPNKDVFYETQALCKSYVMFIGHSENILNKCVNHSPLLWQLTHGRLCFFGTYIKHVSAVSLAQLLIL